jgi:2-polyprenyl-6-methoxyphenol hydroxylase-like FAD-dependent oxidoreductase
VTHCQDLLEELKRLALKRSSTYPAVKIHYHTPVISVDCQGALTLAGGKTVEKDVIIGADGADVGASAIIET